MMMRERTTLRLPAELADWLRQEAERRGDSYNGTIVRFILAGIRSEFPRFPARSL